jgi:hypothetical protein
MAEATIVVHINGYWREEYLPESLSHPGIFFVYEAKHNPEENTVDLLSLIYIGKALNIRERIQSHENIPAWKSFIKKPNELFFASGIVDHHLLGRAKTAYIFGGNPVGNNGHILYFPFDNTTLISTGKTAFIKPTITIRKNFPRYSNEDIPTAPNQMVPVRAIQLDKTGVG